MTTNRLQVLVVGDPSRPEFRDVLPALQSGAMVTAERQLADAASAPDLCILLASVPGEFTSATLQAQLDRWPLTRFIAVAGPLCEGEPRTGHPWPGQTRLYWHEIPGWWALQCARLQDDKSPEWTLPRTSREEDVLRQCAPIRWPVLTGVIGIATSHVESGGTLLAMLREAHLNGCQLRRRTTVDVAGLQAILWDDDDPSDEWHERIAALRDQCPEVPLVALRNFPRIEDRDWLESHWGAPCAVAAKPYDVDVLLSTLALVCGTVRATPLT